MSPKNLLGLGIWDPHCSEQCWMKTQRLVWSGNEIKERTEWKGLVSVTGGDSKAAPRNRIIEL